MALIFTDKALMKCFYVVDPSPPQQQTGQKSPKSVVSVQSVVFDLEPIPKLNSPRKQANKLPRSHGEHREECLEVPDIPCFSNRGCFSVSSVTPWFLSSRKFWDRFLAL